jgi:hypothetical protein
MNATDVQSTGVTDSAMAAAQPEPTPQASGWTGGRVVAVVIGVLFVLVSLGLLGGGLTALWADRTQRDSAGYVMTGVRTFSTSGSAIATEPVDLGSAGVGWLYAPAMLGKVRIQVTPNTPGSAVFVGIGPTAEVDRYLAGASYTLVSDYFGDRSQVIGGGTLASAPGAQHFWVASDTGTGQRTLTWDPSGGSWTVVVMNADGRPGVDVGANLGATVPSLSWITGAALIVGLGLLAGGTILIVAAIRRRRAAAAA